MRTVHIGIGHYNDFIVIKITDVEIGMVSRTKHGDPVPDAMALRRAVREAYRFRRGASVPEPVPCGRIGRLRCVRYRGVSPAGSRCVCRCGRGRGVRGVSCDGGEGEFLTIDNILKLSKKTLKTWGQIA